MLPSSNSFLKFFAKKGRYKLLAQGLHGIEKETLRTDINGHLALTPHPKSLGNKFTDPHITTDFSESQLEFITPPFSKIEQTLRFLEKLHVFTYKNLNNELLWPYSMPNILPKEDLIPIAKYGKSKEAQKREIYRRGLALRYGKAMQTICGIHYNFSFGKEFWDTIYDCICIDKNKYNKQEFINESYLHIVRNFIRYRWLLVYLFGASPIHDKSYKCRNIGQDESKAISLRQSRCGYSNPAKIHVTYNNFNQHIKDLKTAVKKTNPKYKKFGLKKDGQQIQLNDHLLQISNEYYFPIRLKPTVGKSSDMLDGLSNHGVKYIELRIFDLDPFSPTGVTANELYFIHLFIIYCLCMESPPITQKELDESTDNQINIALNGRKNNLKLKRNHKAVSMNKWIEEIFNQAKPIAKMLDKNRKNPKYLKVYKYYLDKIKNPQKLPAYKIIKQIKDSKSDFIKSGIKKAIANKKHFTE